MVNNRPTADDSTERMGWVPCGTCGGSGSTRWFKGNSLTIAHLARGGDPTKLPCGDCRGKGKVWGTVVDRPGNRR